MATFKHEDPRALAKRMYWLAWQACGPAQGMGVFQEREGVTEADVWTLTVQGGHDNGRREVIEDMVNLRRLYADYLFGRMMKCSVGVGEGCVVFPEAEESLTSDYQEWASTYSTYQKLAQVAVRDLASEDVVGEKK